MNNDLEQFSEERLIELAEMCESKALGFPASHAESASLARIALSVKQAKPIGFVGKSYAMTYFMPPQDSGVEIDDLIYTTPQPANTEQDGWVKCSERMPDSDEYKPIAIYTGNCIGHGMFVACYDEDGFFDYWDGVEITGISHWMPLPPPPAAAPKPESEL